MFFDTNTSTEVDETSLKRRGFDINNNHVLSIIGIYPIVETDPHFDKENMTIESSQLVFDENSSSYVREYNIVELPYDTRLANVKDSKYKIFTGFFVKLDQMRARPVAAIAEAIAAGIEIPTADAYILSELEAIIEENRLLRKTVEMSSSIEEVNSIEPWMPETL